MKLINTNMLHKIYEDFQKSVDKGNLQEFVEKMFEVACIDIKPVRKFLKDSIIDAYKFLINSEEDDFRRSGEDYLKRLNFFRAVLDENTELTIDDVKKERKDVRVKFKLIELKTDGSCYEFIIEDYLRKRILCWETMAYIDVTGEYFIEHAFPEDKLYSRQQFLQDVKNLSGYVHFKVERKETAEFIRNMIYELTEVF